jgi:pyruvate-ferredoxin/flavodoxin oxidoreductase
MKKRDSTAKYPGVRAAMDGNTAAIMCERESSDGAGAYPITPSTQMGEYWAEAAAAGHINISGRPLIFIEPEGEHAAAAVTAGMAMTGLRATNFSSGQGIAYMHESLYAAVGKRLTYVLNIGCRAMTKASLNVHAGHDDYHCVDDTGMFQVMAKNAQHVADLNICAHRIAELALTPGIVGQDGFLTTHLIETLMLPERDLIAEYLGLPSDIIDTPTPAQKIIYGEQRRRIPELWNVDDPVLAGPVQNQDSYMQSVAAQRPYFFDHVQDLTDQAFDEFHTLTGRRYERVMTYRCDDADYLLIGQGSVIPTAEAVADWMREERGIRVGVVNVLMFRPFPGDLLSRVLKGRKGAAVLERTDQPLASDLPLIREIRATLSKCLENGRSKNGNVHPELENYSSLKDLPELYSGSFGLGSRDLQPEGVVAAVENMLPDGKHKRHFYLSIDFVRNPNLMTPKQEVYQQAVLDAYPGVAELSLRGSVNPNLMPKDSITVRMHSVGGWGAITTGKNLAMTLYDLLGYHIKANPKYGSEKKGQPTSYYLSAAPEPIRINCEYYYVDVVLSPDPNVFGHTNALAGLIKGGVLVMQSDAASPEDFWASIPRRYREQIVENEIRVFYLDAFRIARDEATDPELQLRMQGIAFQGAFFATSTLLEKHGLSEEALLDAIHEQLQHKFGAKGARVVQDNMRVVRRGFEEIVEVTDKRLEEGKDRLNVHLPVPIMVKREPQSASPSSDIHRFWAQTGSMYATGQGDDLPADPFMSMSLMPAVSSHFRDMTGIRFEHPEFIPENCTGCGDCYTVCPDTAIPGLVNEIGQVLDTVVKRLKKHGKPTEHLPRAVRQMEGKLRKLMQAVADTEPVEPLIEEAIGQTIEGYDAGAKEALSAEFEGFREELGSFQFALCRPYWTIPEKKQAGSGGLLSITVDPYTCKGCMECVEVCKDDALRPVTQTRDTIAELRKNWEFWLDLPSTPEEYIRVDDLEEGIGALETILLNKDAYLPFASGDGACLGCSEKTVIHLFIATVESLMQPRVTRHVKHLDELIGKLKKHVQMKLVGEIDIGDAEEMQAVLAEDDGGDLTLAKLAGRVEEAHETEPIDREWLRYVTDVVAKLTELKDRYARGAMGRGRSSMGILNATGCTSVWGSTYPFNPYPFPWANHLFQDPASMAMGVFEGHMAKMAEGFKAVRVAEALLKDQFDPEGFADQFRYFNWQDFTDEEFNLCPPVVAIGGDGAMYDIGFQNLSRAMMSGKPIKVLVVDTQVYSNTGGQACTSGFFGQVSDMAQYGKAIKGKEEVRKEIGLITMAHRTTYFMQSTMAHANHMIEGFVNGLMSRRPALFNLYSSCQPEHGIGDDMSHHQARLAVESRAYPLFRYDPDAGDTIEECLDLDGNPAANLDWPVTKIRYVEQGREKEMELSTTFVDFAVTETRFRKHFRKIPRDAWHENMVLVSEFLELDEDEREEKVPYVWSLDAKMQLSRLLVAEPMIRAAEDRREFWNMLRELGGVEEETAVDESVVESRIRQEVVQKIASGLMGLVSGNQALDVEAMLGAEAVAVPPPAPAGKPKLAAVESTPAPAAAAEDYMAPWIDTEECTECDECILINPQIFEYNENRLAVIKDPNGGPYRDLVKAAEKCTAGVIHPGIPRDQSAKDIAKWIKRGQKFN